MIKKQLSYLLICILPLFVKGQQHVNKIQVADGPEDFVIDSCLTSPRLLIACDNRRKGERKEGSIWQYRLKDSLATPFPIDFKEYTSSFHPLGISNWEKYLFVINFVTPKKSEVIRFEITADKLVFDTVFRHKHLSYANDLFAQGKERFLISKYKTLNGKLVAYDNGVYSVLDRGIKMPNSVIQFGDSILLSTTLSGKIIWYDASNNYKRKTLFKHIKGADNLSGTQTQLLVASHPDFRAFIKHFHSKENPSPTLLYSLNTITREKKIIFQDTGKLISAGSGGILFNGDLFISQIFDNFIVVIPNLR